MSGDDPKPWRAPRHKRFRAQVQPVVPEMTLEDLIIREINEREVAIRHLEAARAMLVQQLANLKKHE